jgi:replicative DNA helicase
MLHLDPPSSVDAEKAVLGSILLNRDAIVAIADWLRSGDFYYERHGQIYQAMLNCYRKRIPPDTRTVAEALSSSGQLEDIGGVMYLSDLVDAVPSSYHVEYYARTVEAHAIRRALITCGGKIASLGFDTMREVDELLPEAQALLTEATRRSAREQATQLVDVANETFNRLTNGVLPGVLTGYYAYDRLTGGLHPGTLVVLGGRPGNGKSALAACLAERLAGDGMQVLFYSLEMTKEELTQRLIAMRADVDLLAIRRHHLSAAQMDRVVDAMGPVGQLPIWIDDTPSLTLPDMRTRALRFAAERGPIGLLIVDYLQLVQAPIGRGENRAQAVGAVSRGLKALAKELHIPVLALAQLNREFDRRADPVPELADLRESGDIEADADQVAFIVRPELYDRDADKNTAVLHIKKHRGGPIGKIALRFDAPTTRLDNLEERREAPVSRTYATQTSEVEP